MLKRLIVSTIFVSILSVLMLIPVERTIQAKGTAQSNSLQDKLILFGTSNEEASAFDRSDNGASHLAVLLGQAGANIQEINWNLPIPENADLIILISPKKDYTGSQIARLWAYLNRGGRLLLLADPSSVSGKALQSNSALLELLWTDFGLRLLDYGLVNPATEELPIQPLETANEEGTPFPTPEPPISDTSPEIINNMLVINTEHPILQNVSTENLTLKLASPLEIEPFVVSADVNPLLQTNAQAYADADATNLRDFGVYLYDAQIDLPQDNYVVVAASENTVLEAKVVLMGDADLARNGYGFQTSPPGSTAFIFPDSVQLVLNAIYWLVDTDAPDISFDAPQATATATLTPSPTPTAEPTETPEAPEGE